VNVRGLVPLDTSSNGVQKALPNIPSVNH